MIVSVCAFFSTGLFLSAVPFQRFRDVDVWVGLLCH